VPPVAKNTLCSEKKKQPSIDEKSLGYFSSMHIFQEALLRAVASVGLPVSFQDPKRQLLLADYLGLFLFGLLNPVVKSMRGLIAASHLPKVAKDVSRRPVSLGSFSEAQALVDLKLLEAVFADLVSQAAPSDLLPVHLRHIAWQVQDGSLFAALPRMAWALYGGGKPGCVNNAVKLHLSFNLLKDAPARADVRPGKQCERAALLDNLIEGATYVGDRYFGESYAYFTQLRLAGCHYVIRIKDSAVITVEDELEVSATQKAAGIQREAWVRLGTSKSLSERLRLVWITGVTGQTIMVVTDLKRSDLAAEDVALIYRYRWQVEYFFRWVKCILGCGHWMAESRNGVSIQLYLALIGALLLQMHLGRRPSKRIYELYQWYLVGMIEAEDLEKLLSKQLASEEMARARKARN
jgi:hypothetical protein